jgi:hypothetical protein
LISKKNFIKKRKALLSTQEVYTGTQLAHRREPTRTYAHAIPKAQNPEETPIKPKLQKKPPPKKHEKNPQNPKSEIQANPKYREKNPRTTILKRSQAKRKARGTTHKPTQSYNSTT